MKKFFTRGLLFFLTTIATYLVLFAFLFFIKVSNNPLLYRTTQGIVLKGGGTYIKMKDFNVNEKHDIVIIGSSHAYRGYDPRIFKEYGYNAYNLGTSDQNMLCTYFIIKNFINHSNCKSVIIDLYERVFSQKNIESNADMVENISSDKAAFEISLATQDVRTINMLTLRMFSKHFAPLNVDTVGFIRGFLPTSKLISFPLKRRAYKYETNLESLKYLEKTLCYLKKEGVEVIIAEHALPTVSPSPNHNKFREDVMPVLNKYNVQWFDYTTDSTMTSIPYFADETHLNTKGVYKYNHRLINDLIKANLIQHRSYNTSLVLDNK